VSTVAVFHKDVPMETDTGAANSLIGEDLYLRQFPRLPLSPARSLKSCSSHSLDLPEEMNIKMEFNKQTATLPFTAVKGQFPAHFGVPWLYKIRINWESCLPLQEDVVQ
jgi:hypothetical protein